MNIKKNIPKRGEIWLVNLEPTLGVEIKKIRPVIVINSDAIGKLPLKLIAPVTDWKNYFAQNPWHVKIIPNKVNNLSKISAVDTLQLRGVDIQRFQKKLGVLFPEEMKIIMVAILTIIDVNLSEF
ncbi:type II toxin-antitoxin system PemK/MazF family toxin [Geminocystis sp. GBBB08]|uniref:type II toxin-antitoxin system PemK/MazF family toxin n=1 Tax=Geminocystis sp. GBBB08 TaxID=2604140 RepID=UPI0027E3287A|nr:type II toxin-antitoxin system PemK/MazF family toxin [Geminocystis sp. GBBB08]MBL1208714.1 type II toxin-antitoxin system PemK/MazF family toxin [Geminocystis sp. GBBB08]